MTRALTGGVPPARILSVALASALLLSASPAGAQTPFGKSRAAVPTTPPGRTSMQAPSQVPARQTVPVTSQGTVPPQAATEAPTVPVPASVIKQAQSQLEGNFPAMARAGVGGQVQDAWNDAGPREGVQTFRLCADCVYKVRLREFMVTTIVLPDDTEIVTADLGDTIGFQVKVKSANMIAVRPASYGLDTNLNVYSKSGAVYPLYLRAEGFNSRNVPDVLVKIIGRETPPKIESVASEMGAADDNKRSDDGKEGEKGKGPQDGMAKGPDKPADKVAAAVDALTNPKAKDGDFVRSVPFDPAKLHGWRDYKLWGDDTLRPETVFRDGQFTYIQYGDQWDALELPTAYVVIDDIDELVNTRVQGSTLIVESVSALISLKSGKKFLCVQYTGEKP